MGNVWINQLIPEFKYQIRLSERDGLFQGFIHLVKGCSEFGFKVLSISFAAGCHFLFGLWLLASDLYIKRLDTRVTFLSEVGEVLVVLEIGLVEKVRSDVRILAVPDGRFIERHHRRKGLVVLNAGICLGNQCLGVGNWEHGNRDVASFQVNIGGILGW